MYLPAPSNRAEVFSFFSSLAEALMASVGEGIAGAIANVNVKVEGSDS